MFGRAGGISVSTAAVTSHAARNYYSTTTHNIANNNNNSHRGGGEETTKTIESEKKEQQGILLKRKEKKEQKTFSQIPNELIFDKILCYFEYRRILQTARLVCKLWNDHHKIIKTNQCKIKYEGNIEKITVLMNEHSDELHQVTELIIYKTNNLNLEMERQFVSKLINLQNLELRSKDCDISIIKEFAKLQNLKIIQLYNYEHFEEFVHCPSKIKSISVFNRDNVISEVDFSNLNWPLESFTFDCLTSKSILSLLKNKIMTKNLNKLQVSNSILDENAMKEISTLDKLRVLDLKFSKCGDVGAQYISELENLEFLSLNFNLISGSGFSNFRNLTNITKLNLDYNSIDNEGANYLSSLTSLKYLNLRNSNISDEGLKNYSKLSNLSDLYLSNNQIGSIGANYLSDVTSLTFLDLNDNLIGEEGLKNFENLSNLKTLHLENNKIGNGFEYLSNCKEIEHLSISNNNISEECVMKYCKMKPLVYYLYISNNPIGNSGFTSLAKLPKLTTIGANDCGITDKGIFKMLKIIRFKESMTLDLEKNYLTNKSLKKMIKSKHIDNIQYLYISNTNSELDSNYLNILSEKLFYLKCTQPEEESEKSEKSKDNKNRCTIQ